MRALALLMPALALAAAALPARAAVPAPTPAARAAWGFDKTDLAPHPGVRFGALANGMRYALMRAEDGGRGLAVRFHIDAGAAIEGPLEVGAMHLIEHLIFHGSARFSEGSVPLLLAHRGMRRWTDFNAVTTFDSTLFCTDLPQSDQRSRQSTIDVAREIADGLRFSARTLAAAKKAVIREIQARDQAADRLATARNRFLVPHAPLARGPVAGTTKSVRRLTAAALARLYARTYRPENATLIMVGDFDPAEAEAQIVRGFGNWRAAQAAPSPDAALKSPSLLPATAIHVDPAIATTLTAAFVSPIGGNDRGRLRDSAFLTGLGNALLDRRLARLAGTTTFRRAGAASYAYFGAAQIDALEVEANGRDWRRASSAAGTALREAVAEGFAPAELAAIVAESRAALARPTRPKSASQLADALADAVDRDLFYTGPADGGAGAAYLGQVRLDDVNAAFRAAWNRPGLRLFLAHNRAIPGGEAALASHWARSSGPASPRREADTAREPARPAAPAARRRHNR